MHYRFFMSLAYQQSARTAQKSNLQQNLMHSEWLWNKASGHGDCKNIDLGLLMESFVVLRPPVVPSTQKTHYEVVWGSQ